MAASIRVYCICVHILSIVFTYTSWEFILCVHFPTKINCKTILYNVSSIQVYFTCEQILSIVFIYTSWVFILCGNLPPKLHIEGGIVICHQKCLKLSLQLFTHIVLKINADLNYKNYFMIFLNPKKTRRSGKGKPAFFYIRS